MAAIYNFLKEIVVGEQYSKYWYALAGALLVFFLAKYIYFAQIKSYDVYIYDQHGQLEQVINLDRDDLMFLVKNAPSQLTPNKKIKVNLGF